MMLIGGTESGIPAPWQDSLQKAKSVFWCRGTRWGSCYSRIFSLHFFFWWSVLGHNWSWDTRWDKHVLQGSMAKLLSWCIVCWPAQDYIDHWGFCLLVGWGFITIYPFKTRGRGNMFHDYHSEFHLIIRNSRKVSPSASCIWHTVQYPESSII